jgi:hypothetical protein
VRRVELHRAFLRLTLRSSLLQRRDSGVEHSTGAFGIDIEIHLIGETGFAVNGPEVVNSPHSLRGPL